MDEKAWKKIGKKQIVVDTICIICFVIGVIVASSIATKYNGYIQSLENRIEILENLTEK